MERTTKSIQLRELNMFLCVSVEIIVSKVTRIFFFSSTNFMVIGYLVVISTYKLYFKHMYTHARTKFRMFDHRSIHLYTNINYNIAFFFLDRFNFIFPINFLFLDLCYTIVRILYGIYIVIHVIYRERYRTKR